MTTGGSAPARPWRVLMVTGAYHPETSSGGLQAQRTARHMAGRAEVSVLTTAVERGLPAREKVDSVWVTRVFVDTTSAFTRAASAPALARATLRLVPRADVVHLHGCSAKNVPIVAAARLLGRPVVLSLHTSGHDEPEALRRQGALAWRAFRAVDAWLPVSPALETACLEAGLPAGRVFLVPNGIDLDRFRPADASERAALRARLGLPLGRPLIVFVGFFSEDKQPHTLFRAWRHLAERKGLDTTLVFVGATVSPYFEVDAGLAAVMREEAGRAGALDRLVFAGVTRDVPDYLRAADVFVLPSRREGLPVALLEAMACGLPCVASRLPGATDAVMDDGVNGRLVSVGDAEAFAGAMAELIGRPEAAAALGAAARQTAAARFGSARTAERWLAAYGAVAGEARA